MEDIDRTSVMAICNRMRDGLEGRPASWLAELTGDKEEDVRRWLRGNNKPPIDFVVRYCKATGYSADWVLMEKGLRVLPDESAALAGIQKLLQAADEVRGMVRVPLSAFRPMPRSLDDAETG